MTSPSSAKRKYSERSNYGFARARDIAFAAVRELWDQRQAEGMKQSDICTAIERDKGWVSKQLSGPGNWTLRTLGELCEALDGELEIIAHKIEIPAEPFSNYHAYAGYGEPELRANKPVGVFQFRSESTPNTYGNNVRVLELTR